jgi:hypothetical protein
MKKYYLYFIVFFVSVISISCNDQKDGGSCKYDTKIVPATVISLVDTNDLSYDVLFEVTTEGRKDTLHYSDKNNNNRIFIQDIPKDSMKPGTQYQYIIQTRLTGTCAPVVDFILLKPYTSS